MIKGIRHTGIVVANMKASLDFWESLGFVVHRKSEEPTEYADRLLGLLHTRLSTVKLRSPTGQLIELLHFASHPSTKKWEGTPYTTGITHIAMTVDKLDDGIVSPDGKVKVAYIRAPDGVLLELVEELC